MTAAAIVDAAAGVLLDFDGPVSSIFAGLSALQVADDLRGVLREHGGAIDGAIANQSDPMEVRHYAANVSDGVLAHVDSALRAAELQAATTANPTPGAADFIRYVSDRGTPLVIVSNNSSPAIRQYLQEHGLVAYVRGVIGRSFARPDLMKPHPWPLIRGIELISSRTGGCVIIGDSVADITAARSAHVASIGYANRPEKLQTLADAGADAIVTGMAQLFEHVRNWVRTYEAACSHALRQRCSRHQKFIAVSFGRIAPSRAPTKYCANSHAPERPLQAGEPTCRSTFRMTPGHSFRLRPPSRPPATQRSTHAVR